MAHECHATGLIHEGGRLELLVPDSLAGAQVQVTIRPLPRHKWIELVGKGTLRGPSLTDDATSRESIYSEDANS